MFLLISCVSIIYGFLAVPGAQCFTIASESSANDVQNVTQVVQNQENRISPEEERELSVDLQSLESSQKMAPNFEEPSTVGQILDRQPRYFGGLAFLAGLGVGGLSSAASTNIPSLAKLTNAAPLANPGPLAYYNPYSFLAYPYLQPYPGWYSFQDSTRVQHPVAPAGNNPLPQQNLKVETEAQQGEISAVEEEYAVEENKMENGEKRSENAEEGKKMENDDEHSENAVEDDAVPEMRTDEENTVNQAEATATEKNGSLGKATNDKIKKQEDHFDEVETSPEVTRAVNKLNVSMTVQNNSKNASDASNSTVQRNQTSTPQFQGYYGGSPQPIGHVFLTEEHPLRGYQEYNENLYNLPFDRPANFEPYGRYDPYPNGHLGLFSPADKTAEYLSSVDFNHFDYPMENTPAANGFRPIV